MPSPKTFAMPEEKVKWRKKNPVGVKKSAEGRIERYIAKSGEEILSIEIVPRDTKRLECHIKKPKENLAEENVPRDTTEKRTEGRVTKRKIKSAEIISAEIVPRKQIAKDRSVQVAIDSEKALEGRTERHMEKRKKRLLQNSAHVEALTEETLNREAKSRIKITKMKPEKKSSKINVAPIGVTKKSQEETINKISSKKKNNSRTSTKIQTSNFTPSDTQKPLSRLQKKKAAKRAFKKQQLKAKRTGKVKKDRPPTATIFEPPADFDEDKFSAIVNISNIEKVAKALKVLVAKEITDRKSSAIFKDFRYFLNVSSFKIPSCPKHMVKLKLKHSLVRKDDDVVIVVPDLQRGAKIDYEPTIQHYEDLFRGAGITGLKVMPFNQLRNECNTFETVRKFASCYEYFLCDGRLVGHVAGFCGKIFQKPRTTFHAVRMENPKNLKNEIEKSLRRTAYKQLNKGDLISIPVGTDEHTEQQLAENVEYVVSQLKKNYPGGWANIRGMHLKIDITGTSALPIYMSAGIQAAADAPYIVGPREQRLLKLKKVANEVLSKFSLTKEAEILKLTKTQVERKRKVVEMRDKLLQDRNPTPFKEIGDKDPKQEKKKTKKPRVVNKKLKARSFTSKIEEKNEGNSELAEVVNENEGSEEEDNSVEGSSDDEDSSEEI